MGSLFRSDASLRYRSQNALSPSRVGDILQSRNGPNFRCKESGLCKAVGSWAAGKGFGLPNLRRAACRAVLCKFACQLAPFLGIAMKDRIFSHTILQAGEVGKKLMRRLGRKPVDHPIRFLPGLHQPMSTKVS